MSATRGAGRNYGDPHVAEGQQSEIAKALGVQLEGPAVAAVAEEVGTPPNG